MKQLLSLVFSTLFLMTISTVIIAQKGKKKEHIAGYINHLPFIHIFESDTLKESLFNKKGDTYELNEHSLDYVQFTLEKITPTCVELSTSDYGGTSYQADAHLHYYLLDNKLPTILVWGTLKGTSYESGSMIREDAYNILLDELDAQGKTESDIPESEFDSLLNKITNELIAARTQDETIPFFAQEDFNQLLIVWQKQHNVWVDITKTAFPADFTAEYIAYFPFFKSEQMQHGKGYGLWATWYDMDIEANHKLLETIFGTSQSENTIELHYSPEKGIQYISSALSSYELSLKWNGKQFVWDKKPAKKPIN